MGSQACNGEGTGFGQCDCGEPDAGAPDAGPPAPCDPVAQTGCTAGERCTWVETAPGVGEMRCVPDGTVAEGEDCTEALVGMPDECVAGTVCLLGACRRICSATGGCATDFSCALESGFADATTIGRCSPTCDPVRQTRDYDSAPACGSPDPLSPTLGCYGPLEGPFTCYTVTTMARTLVHGDPASGLPGSTPFVNGCAPGYLPAMRSSSAPTSEIICVATCDPLETSLSRTAGSQGLPPYSCADREGTTSAEECRFHWFLLGGADLPAPRIIGLCIDPNDYAYDHDEVPFTADVPWPRCTELPEPDHLEWGCGPMPP